jgi:hypothetical protein
LQRLGGVGGVFATDKDLQENVRVVYRSAGARLHRGGSYCIRMTYKSLFFHNFIFERIRYRTGILIFVSKTTRAEETWNFPRNLWKCYCTKIPGLYQIEVLKYSAHAYEAQQRAMYRDVESTILYVNGNDHQEVGSQLNLPPTT